MRIYAPFTDEQTHQLNAWQVREDVHPYTCPDCDNLRLIASRYGWFCPGCDRRQYWAHGFLVGA